MVTQITFLHAMIPRPPIALRLIQLLNCEGGLQRIESEFMKPKKTSNDSRSALAGNDRAAGLASSALLLLLLLLLLLR